MATSKNNCITQGLSGMIGDTIVFRQVEGKTIIANRPRKPRYQSERQKENRRRFRQAASFARTAMRDPVKKEYYRKRAGEMNLTNAYTAALTLHLRKDGNMETSKESKPLTSTRNGIANAEVTKTIFGPSINAKPFVSGRVDRFIHFVISMWGLFSHDVVGGSVVQDVTAEIPTGSAKRDRAVFKPSHARRDHKMLPMHRPDDCTTTGIKNGMFNQCRLVKHFSAVPRDLRVACG